MRLLTEALVLRTVTDDDIAEIARMWNFQQGGVSIEKAWDALAYMTQNHERNAAGQFYHLCFAVCEKDVPRRILGWCGLDGKTYPERPELFVLLHEDARGKGYGTQCAKALLAHAFGAAGIRYVHGSCDRRNIASARMMKKAGMAHYADSPTGAPLFLAEAGKWSGDQTMSVYAHCANNDWKIRRAKKTDMPQALLLVDAVFTGEQGIPAWMNPVPEERQPQWWCAEAEGRIVGTVVAYAHEGKCHMGRIAVAADMRGRGIGTQLMRCALRELFEQGIESVHMEARDATVRILMKMGAEITGEPFLFYGANCTPIVLRREKYIAE